MALGQDEVGRRIQRARDRAGLTQQELAEAIGLKHGQQVSKYERGLVEIPVKKLARIAKATGERIDALLGEEPATLGEAEFQREVRAELAAIRSLVEQLAEGSQDGEPPQDGDEPV